MNFWAAGKLLLFGEYFVLKGVDGLAIPLKFGQALTVEKASENTLHWESFELGKKWFDAVFTLDLKIIETTEVKTAETLRQLLELIASKNKTLFKDGLSFQVKANFSLDWGLGSSSTLISLLSQWSGVNPYFLLDYSFGGSGYDIACATATSPILYNGETRNTIPMELPKDITHQLLFVYSGNKQNSQKEVAKFNRLKINETEIRLMQRVVNTAKSAVWVQPFADAVRISERLLSGVLVERDLKTKFFSDYPNEIKSLGAWGGDFYMAIFEDEINARNYFHQKGYSILFTYNEIIRK